MNYICKKIEILYYLICFINYYLLLAVHHITLTPTSAGPTDIMASNASNAPNAPRKPGNPGELLHTCDLTGVVWNMSKVCPYAPKPARGEMEPIYGLDTVACELFLVLPRAPRKLAMAPVQRRVNKCNVCRKLTF